MNHPVFPLLWKNRSKLHDTDPSIQDSAKKNRIAAVLLKNRQDLEDLRQSEGATSRESYVAAAFASHATTFVHQSVQRERTRSCFALSKEYPCFGCPSAL